MSYNGDSETMITVLALINDCYKEAASTMNFSEDQVTERVMNLFRHEDLQGIAKLMEQTKLEKEFLTDLQQFVKKWSVRVSPSLE